jgi:hypothetical protein
VAVTVPFGVSVTVDGLMMTLGPLKMLNAVKVTEPEKPRVLVRVIVELMLEPTFSEMNDGLMLMRKPGATTFTNTYAEWVRLPETPFTYTL